MDTVIEALRQVIGEPDFYKRLTDTSNYTWDYGAMIEYIVASIIVMIVISYIFKGIKWLFAR